MAQGAIDLNRGVLIRKVRSANMKVFMYFDTPGVYLNVHGKEVPEAVAEAAGFDIAKYAKQRLKREKMQEFEKTIEAQLAMEDEAEDVAPKVLAEAGGFQMIDAKLGNVWVIDADGERMNDRPINAAEGKLLLDVLSAPAPKGKPKLKTADETAATV